MNKSIRIVIAALGGEGGGVLGKWIADMAAREGFLSQTTSVPGVAQRTGATIYYIEIFPRSDAEAAAAQPVLSMFPTPGDVDIVICSEIVEAGRMVQRGFVTPDRTTLITSTHRTYGIGEKTAMGNGIVDSQALSAVCSANAKAFIGFDMLEVARRHDSVINAALFGAIFESGVLPFSREAFEETIRLGKIAIDSNLATFAASYELALKQASGGVEQFEPAPVAESAFGLLKATTARGEQLTGQVAQFPQDVQQMIYLGVKKLAAYQDYDYAQHYLDKLNQLPQSARENSELLAECARFLALWMAFEDLPRVAEIKISAARSQRFRDEVKAAEGQLVDVVEFLHPRVEEFCAVMPAKLGRAVLNSPTLSKIIGLFAGPRNLRTNSIHGFLQFYLIAKLRRFRRSSLAYAEEHAHIEHWFSAVCLLAETDQDAALELAKCGRLIKGYGSTRERGNCSMQRILKVIADNAALKAADIAALRDAALADDQGKALSKLERQWLGAEVVAG